MLSRRYIFDAILKVLKEREIINLETAVPSKDLVLAVSDISAKKISANRIGKHLGILYGEKIVDRVRMKDKSHTHKWWLR